MLEWAGVIPGETRIMGRMSHFVHISLCLEKRYKHAFAKLTEKSSLVSTYIYCSSANE